MVKAMCKLSCDLGQVRLSLSYVSSLSLIALVEVLLIPPKSSAQILKCILYQDLCLCYHTLNTAGFAGVGIMIMMLKPL